MAREKFKPISTKAKSLDISFNIPEFETQVENDSAMLARCLNIPFPEDFGEVAVGDCESDKTTVVFCPKDSIDNVFDTFFSAFTDENRKTEVKEQLMRNRFILVRVV